MRMSWEVENDGVDRKTPAGDGNRPRGGRVTTEGENNIQSRRWQDQDGNNRVAIEVIANEVQFAGSKKGDNGSSTNATPNYRTPSNYSVPDGNTPLPAGGNDFNELAGDEEVPF